MTLPIFVGEKERGSRTTRKTKEEWSWTAGALGKGILRVSAVVTTTAKEKRMAVIE